MEYTCRASARHKLWTHRLNGQTLELINQKGEVKQTVELGTVRKIQQYDGIDVSDPETGPYDSEYCKIVPARGWSVYLRNGSYVRPSGKFGEVVVNQNDDYVTFLIELKRRVASENPKVPVISGWLLASLAWWALALLGLLVFAFMIGGFMMDKFITALGIAAFCIPVGCMCLMLGFQLGRNYWPSQTTVAENLILQEKK